MNIPKTLWLSFGNYGMEQAPTRRVVKEYMLRARASYPLAPHVGVFNRRRELERKEIYKLAEELGVETVGDFKIGASHK